MPEPLPPSFAIAASGDDGRQTLRLSGELDISVEAEYAAALDTALATGSATLLLDLRDLEFMDSCGIRMLLDAQRHCAAHNRRLVLVRPPRAVLRPLDICGLTGHFEMVDAPEALLKPAA